MDLALSGVPRIALNVRFYRCPPLWQKLRGFRPDDVILRAKEVESHKKPRRLSLTVPQQCFLRCPDFPRELALYRVQVESAGRMKVGFPSMCAPFRIAVGKEKDISIKNIKQLRNENKKEKE